MILIFSDMHLGRFPEQDDEILCDLRSCISEMRTLNSETIREVVFLGDVFDAFIEFTGNLPEIAIRFSTLIADMQSIGIAVSYHVGNHDPWHKNYFDKQLDGRLYRKPRTRRIGKRMVYLSHGDESETRSIFGSLARSIMRSDLSFTLYTALLPNRFGQRLPQWVSRKFSGLGPDPTTIQALHLSGLEILDSTDVDLVIYGHAHQSTTDISIGGQYVNTGSWLLSRSYAELTNDSIQIKLYSVDTH